MQAYLQVCIEESNNDAAFIAKALGNIARAKGMAQLSKDTGLGRESLYKALSGEVIRNELMEVDLRDIGTLYAPERVKNKIVEMVPELYNGTQSEMISIRQKGE